MTPPGSIPSSPVPSGHLSDASTAVAGPSSFRVNRNRPNPSTSSLSPRQEAPLATVPEPADEYPVDFSGYAAAMFQPLDLEFGDTEENRQRYSQQSSSDGYGQAL